MLDVYGCFGWLQRVKEGVGNYGQGQYPESGQTEPDQSFAKGTASPEQQQPQESWQQKNERRQQKSRDEIGDKPGNRHATIILALIPTSKPGLTA